MKGLSTRTSAPTLALCHEGSLQLATIYDIARRAGVSITTVSRVLNGSDLVSERTRELVQSVIEDEEYSPSHIARSLVAKTTYTIGVLGTEISNPYFAEMIEGVQEAAARYSLQILVQNTRDAEGEIASVGLLLDRRVDGLIFVARHEAAPSYHHIVSAAGRIPVVLIGHPLPGTPVFSVRADEEAGSYTLGRELVRLGHYRFLFLGGTPGSHPAEAKIRGLRRALAGLEQSRLEIEWAGYTYDGVRRALRARTNAGLLSWCTAVVCVSDVVATSALDVLHETGVSVPDTVSVTGFDNVAWARSLRPALTTVDPNKQLLAGLAVEVMQAARARQETRRNILVSTQVVWRNSHGPCP